MNASRPENPAPRVGTTLQRLALYLLYSLILHAAPLLAWLVEGPAAETEDPTRIRLLDRAEEAALARADAERAAARAVQARLLVQRAEAAQVEAERRAEVVAAVARRAVERLDEARRAEGAAEAPRPKVAGVGKAEGAPLPKAETGPKAEGAPKVEPVPKAETAPKAEAAPKAETPARAREATEIAKREVEDALAARLEADRAVEAAQRTAEDARVAAARADAMKAEAVREAARIEARADAVRAEAAKAQAMKAETPREPPPPAVVEKAPPKAPETPPKPKPPPQASVQERGGAKSGGTGDDVATWLAFVRSEGAHDDTPDADARFISDRNRRAPRDTRALADVARANGEGRAEADIATRTSTASKQGDGARGTAARVDLGQPTPPPATPPVPRSSPRAAPGTPGGHAGVRVPVDVVELPYVAEAPGPAPAAPGESLRLSAGEVAASPGPAGTGTSTRRAARRPAPAPPPPPAVPSPVPSSAERPKAPRPPLEDDFWSASTVPTLADPDRASDTLDTTAAPKPDPFLLAAEAADAHGWSDLAILDDTAPLADETRYGARAHVLGPWLSAMDDTLRRRWVYPPALRALGVEGTVVVRFHVSPTGVVSNVQVQSGSGTAELDLASLAAIPARVGAMPAGSDGLWRRVVFRYRASAR